MLCVISPKTAAQRLTSKRLAGANTFRLPLPDMLAGRPIAEIQAAATSAPDDGQIGDRGIYILGDETNQSGVSVTVSCTIGRPCMSPA